MTPASHDFDAWCLTIAMMHQDRRAAQGIGERCPCDSCEHVRQHRDRIVANGTQPAAPFDRRLLVIDAITGRQA